MRDIIINEKEGERYEKEREICEKKREMRIFILLL